MSRIIWVWGVLYCVYHWKSCSFCYLICNHSQFQSWYCLYEVLGSGSKCAKSGPYNPHWYWLKLASGIPYWLRGVCVSSKVDHVDRLFDTFTSCPYHLQWYHISALKLAMVPKEHTLQWYTTPYTSFPNKASNIWFTKYSKLSVGTLCVLKCSINF